jgi:fructose-bisphosphate aldolase class I
MIISGKDSGVHDSREIVAESTVKCLTASVPSSVAGIVFLSGGQSDEDATAHLNLMNAMDIEHPWQLSYSYGRALQSSALQTWAAGTPGDSQAAFAHRAKMNSLARSGEWNTSHDS